MGLDWTIAAYKLRQLISLYCKSGCFPETLYGKDLYPILAQLENGVRTRELYDQIMNFIP